MTGEIHYSLCQTMIAYYPSGTSYSKLLRLADLMFNSQNSGKTGDRLYPFDSSSDYPDVPMIKMAKGQAILNELCIWKIQVTKLSDSQTMKFYVILTM
jgi:hypothetical protein